MSQETTSAERIDIISNRVYGEGGYPHEAWARLRREAPVYRVEGPDVLPFWAITRYADLVSVSKQPHIFENAPRLAVFPEFERPGEQPPARHLINMDPPEHGKYRRLVSSRFTPRSVERMREGVHRIARDYVDEMMRDGDFQHADFVEVFSSRLPLAVLADLLGVPRSDWELMFRWTNETIGSTDPEIQQGKSAEDTAEGARLALFQYFAELAEERRKRPADDIVSILAGGTVDGDPLPVFELLSYYFLLVVAGNETTRNATSGGMLALIEHPEQLARLREDPTLLDGAVEEILRWTSPVIQFCRTPNRDVEIRGQQIRKGENLCLFYPSANRDEEIFVDSMRFRIDRSPNPHVAFGIGEHVCLGAHLARLELRAAFGQLIERLEHIELTGAADRLHSSFVGGIKRMPIRYRLRP